MIGSFLLILSLFFQPDDSIRKTIDIYLNKKLNQYEKYEYEIVKGPNDFKSINIIEENQLNINGNILYLPVELIEKKGGKSKSLITLKIKLYKNVLASLKPIERKQNLIKANFQILQVDVTQVRGNPITSFNEIDKYRSKVNIKSGSILVDEFIEPAPVILAGEKVTANSVYGNVVISTEATSRQDGITGEVISVITADKKQFKAKVIDQQNVLIIE